MGQALCLALELGRGQKHAWFFPSRDAQSSRGDGRSSDHPDRRHAVLFRES